MRHKCDGLPSELHVDLSGAVTVTNDWDGPRSVFGAQFCPGCGLRLDVLRKAAKLSEENGYIAASLARLKAEDAGWYASEALHFARLAKMV